MTYPTPEATAKATALRALLAELDLTPSQAHALLIAEEIAEEAQDGITLQDVLEARAEDGREAWADVLCWVTTFLAD